jgi:hypothetical protein
VGRNVHVTVHALAAALAMSVRSSADHDDDAGNDTDAVARLFKSSTDAHSNSAVAANSVTSNVGQVMTMRAGTVTGEPPPLPDSTADTTYAPTNNASGCSSIAPVRVVPHATPSPDDVHVDATHCSLPTDHATATSSPGKRDAVNAASTITDTNATGSDRVMTFWLPTPVTVVDCTVAASRARCWSPSNPLATLVTVTSYHPTGTSPTTCNTARCIAADDGSLGSASAVHIGVGTTAMVPRLLSTCRIETPANGECVTKPLGDNSDSCSATDEAASTVLSGGVSDSTRSPHSTVVADDAASLSVTVTLKL